MMCYDERLTRVDVAGYSGENRRLASAKHEMAKARQTLHDVTMRAEVVNSDIARIAGAPAGSFKDDAAAIADLREDVFQAMDNLNVAEAHHSAAKAMLAESRSALRRATIRDALAGALASAAGSVGILSVKSWAQNQQALKLKSMYAMQLSKVRALLGVESVAAVYAC